MNDHPSIIGYSAEIFIHLTIEEARARYLSIYPRKKNEDFDNEILFKLDQSANISGDAAAIAFLTALSKNIKIKSSTFPLIISVAYCLQAEFALKDGDREKAWSCIAEARYWCGTMHTKDEIDISIEGIVKATNKNKAKNAAEAHHKIKYGEIKKTVHLLAVNLMPTDGWKSRRKAHIVIFEYLNSNGKLAPLTESQAKTTIDRWLKEMPNSSELFPKKTTKSAE